jgi:copper chaperone
MALATFDTPSVSCMSCMAKIEDALAPAAGVHDIDVDIAAKQVRVSYDDAATDRDAIAQVIRDAGYDVGGVSA